MNLVIAAHPDDEVLGCGGTIKRLTRDGDEVTVAVLGEGLTSRASKPDRALSAKASTIEDQCRGAARLLGVRDVLFFGLPDNRFDTVPLLDIVKMLEDVIARTRPSVVYTQHGGDLNIDHALTFRATLAATRPMQGRTVRSLVAYEVPSSTDWAFEQFSPRFCAQRFVDISGTLDAKIRAMETYESEVRPYPHPRSIESLIANARRRGSMVGLEAAEAFSVVWDIV